MPNYPMYPQNYPQFPTYPQYPVFQQPQMSGAPQPMTQPVQPQPAPVQPIQSSPPVPVRSEQEARNWPIAPGNSVTFINEGERYVYTKTSLNQFDQPQFVKYRLVKEEDAEAVQTSPQSPVVPMSAAPAPAAPMPDYALKADVDALKGEVMGEIEGFRARLDSLASEKPAGKGKKKEADGDD